MASTVEMKAALMKLIEHHPERDTLEAMIHNTFKTSEEPQTKVPKPRTLKELVESEVQSEITPEDISKLRTDGIFDPKDGCVKVYVGKEKFLVPTAWIVPAPGCPENVIYRSLKDSKDRRISFPFGNSGVFSVIYKLLSGIPFVDLLEKYIDWDAVKQQIISYGLYHLLQPVRCESVVNLKMLRPRGNGSSVIAHPSVDYSDANPVENSDSDTECPWFEFRFPHSKVALTKFSADFGNKTRRPERGAGISDNLNFVGSIMVFGDANDGDKVAEPPHNPNLADPSVPTPKQFTLIQRIDCGSTGLKLCSLEITISPENLGLHKYIRIYFVKGASQTTPVYINITRLSLHGGYVAQL